MGDTLGNQVNDRDHAEYVRLLFANQSRIYSFIHMLVPSIADADDIMQETATVMWEKFHEYERGTDFAAWAVTIARFKILNFRRKQGRSIVHYSTETLDVISELAAQKIEGGDSLVPYLRDCLSKLKPKDLHLIQVRYSENITTKALAARIGRSVHGVYSAMARIHANLVTCIDRVRIAEEHV